MRINLTASLFAQRQLSQTTKAIARSMQRLSTGLEVNSARDDAARLSISNKLEAQTRGLIQANRNINDAQGMLVTAESAIDSQMNIVIRMRELAVQAANGTLTSSDRTNINQELAQLYDEYKRITSTTEFAGQKLLDGSMGQRSLQVGAVDDNNVGRVRFEISDMNKMFTKTVGTGSFTNTNSVSMTSILAQQAGDVNNDGKVDIVSTSVIGTYGSVRLGNGDGTFGTTTTFNIDPNGSSLHRLADMNNDGNLDLITTSGITNAIQLGNGDGTFRAPVTTSIGSIYSTLEIADVNRDGKLDIIQSDADLDTISVYLGKGDGTVQSALTFATDFPVFSSYGPGIKVADMTNDGILDIVQTNYNTGKFTIYNGRGDGTFTAGNSYSIGTTPGEIQLADLNNDGRMDIVAARANGIPGVYAMLQTATGSFTATQTISAGSSTSSNLGVTDLNGDGKKDLVFHNGSSISVYLGNGDGTFTAQSTLTGGASPMSFADVNSDGVVDIITRASFVNAGIWSAKTISTSAVSDVDVSTQSKAQNLISVLDTTLSNLKAEQAKIGGIHDRLDMAASANLILSDNLTEAKSMMTDADFALETAELVRNQILQQAQVAALAQANLNVNNVLAIFKASGI